MVVRRVRVIATIGPATWTEEALQKLKAKGVDFVRVNLSHSSIDDLKYSIALAKKVCIPFIVDTQGSQIRTGDLSEKSITLDENDEVKIYVQPVVGDKTKICLTPGYIVQQLEEGDLLYVDFDTLILRVADVSTLAQGYVVAKAISHGILGRNKGVVIDPAMGRDFSLQSLSERDLEAIRIGLAEGVDHVAVSFVRSGETVSEVRRLTKGKMVIISKIECIDALLNIDDIIDKSDYLLIDRGDLSKEISIERIPLTQKIILSKARAKNKGVFVATNLLETMVEKRKPTRAEVHDIMTTILDGAAGLCLSAETAIGKYPMECVNMMNKLILHAEESLPLDELRHKEEVVTQHLAHSHYLTDFKSSALIEPHGGKLVDGVMKHKPRHEYLDSLPRVILDENKQMDVEQIAFGVYSPIEGFMTRVEVQSVLDHTRLPNGLVWPLPIVLDVSEEKAHDLHVGQDVALVDHEDTVLAVLHLREKYLFDKTEMAQKLYGTLVDEHPGVRMVKGMGAVFLGGKVSLLRRRASDMRAYELTPRQIRRLFDERGWARVVGFHTRNVIHRSHEFIQLEAMNREHCDGLFVHPVVGKKKPGDYQAKYIIESYEKMMREFYPKNKVVFSVFCTYSRYAGPREALFTALCRKNYGCSHFIVGRDHTGVGNFYPSTASHEVFTRFPDIGIKAVTFDHVFYSKKLAEHVHAREMNGHTAEDQLLISGTEARKMFEAGAAPPDWFMRPEIAQIILDAMKKGEEVFVGGK
jgi:pyruvate kinase